MQNNIENLRKAKGLTQKDLAKALETSQQQIARLEKGERKLNAEWIDKFCRLLSCQPGELIEFTPSKNPKTKVITKTAEVIGEIETAFSNMIKTYDEDEKYDITFKPPRNSNADRYFALVVKGPHYKNYPKNSELIFAENYTETIDPSFYEDDREFAEERKVEDKEHRFVIDSETIYATLIKSIRNE